MGEDLGSTNQVSETWSQETIRFWISLVVDSETQCWASWGMVQTGKFASDILRGPAVGDILWIWVM